MRCHSQRHPVRAAMRVSLEVHVEAMRPAADMCVFRGVDRCASLHVLPRGHLQ